MPKKKGKIIPLVFCDKCHYGNNPDYLKYSGVCHGCGKILDEKAYFKAQMNKKMRLWKNKRRYYNNWHSEF